MATTASKNHNSKEQALQNTTLVTTGNYHWSENRAHCRDFPYSSKDLASLWRTSTAKFFKCELRASSTTLSYYMENCQAEQHIKCDQVSLEVYALLPAKTSLPRQTVERFSLSNGAHTLRLSHVLTTLPAQTLTFEGTFEAYSHLLMTLPAKTLTFEETFEAFLTC